MSCGKRRHRLSTCPPESVEFLCSREARAEPAGRATGVKANTGLPTGTQQLALRGR